MSQFLGMDIEKIRQDFPILARRLNGLPIIYFDNAATTQKPISVIEKLKDFYFNYNANIRRGVSTLTVEATEIFEKARERIKNFFNAQNYELIFTKSTTESINLVAYSLVKSFFNDGDEIILSEAEHHSNIVPYHLINAFKKLKLKFISIDGEGYLCLDELKELISAKVKLIALTHISNVLGIVYPVEEAIEVANAYNIPILIDGAQSAPRIAVNLDKLNPTFFVFSAHKMLGPNGVGFLFVRKDFTKNMAPFLGGGGMITEVEKEYSYYLDVPFVFEGGTIDYPCAVAFTEALNYIEKIGMDNIHNYEKSLTKKLLSVLEAFPQVEIMGTKNVKDKVGTVSFNLKNIHSHDLNTILDSDGILVRSGHHCAQLVMKKFGVNGVVRVSFYLYNTEAEIDRFSKSLQKAVELFKI